MTNITRVDQAVLQLRAQLQRLARERTGGSSAPGSVTASPLQRLRETKEATPDEEKFRRCFVRALLTEELGEGLANQVEFEQISSQVWQLIDEDEETRALMDEAIRQLDAGKS